MVKRVVDKRMVAHLWANQSQDEAYTASRNFSFNGVILKSYRTTVGRIVQTVDGGRVALLTNRKYSVTTSAQMRAARSALPSNRCFEVPFIGDFDDQIEANYAWLLSECRDAFKAHATARMGTFAAGQYANGDVRAASAGYYAVDRANRFADAFGLARVDFTAEQEAAHAAFNARFEKYMAQPAVAKREAARIAREAAQEAALAERRARQHVEQEARRNAWLAGADVYYNGTTPQGGAYMRVIGDELQTSMGASVPLSDAIKVFRAVQLVMTTGRAWHRNGEIMPVGQFQVDHITPDGTMRAGCHIMAWPEIEHAAKQAGIYH
jgi:hypothetical protein